MKIEPAGCVGKFESYLTMECIEQNRAKIKAVAGLAISSTAKLVGQVMVLTGATAAVDLIELTGLPKTTAYRAMGEFIEAGGMEILEQFPSVPVFPPFPLVGIPTIPTSPTDGNCSQNEVPLVPPVGISDLAPTCADITTRANKESSSKILIPSKVKEVSEDNNLICEKLAKPKGSPRGARLSDDWQLPDDWRQWARVTFPATTADQIQNEADTFADYWRGIPGAKGCKLDWSGTWRNWCRRNFARGPIRPGAFNGPAQKTRGTYRPSISEMAQALEELEAEREFAQ